MQPILKHVGRLVALMVAGVLAMTVLSGAPASAAPIKSHDVQPATSSEAVAARTVARVKCNWRARKCFGSIAVNTKTLKAFILNDRKSKSAARHGVMKQCRKAGNGKNCKSAGWARNACLAVAIRIKGGVPKKWASAGAFRIKKAKKKAKHKVAGPGTEKIWAYLCTTRRR